jgi:hypothetical protein
VAGQSCAGKFRPSHRITGYNSGMTTGRSQSAGAIQE